MIVNFLTKKLTPEQRVNFYEACKLSVNENVVVNVEETVGSYTFIVNMFNKGCDNRLFYFIMRECDFDFIIPYTYTKLLQAGSQICRLHNTIAQFIEK